MKKVGRAIAVSALMASAAAGAQPPGDIDQIVAQFVPAGSPGCSVAVGKDGRQLFSRAYGVANVEHGVPITASTRFNIASVSKQFVAASILLLVEEGKVSLQDDVRKFIPELPDYGAKLTVDHLLTHTSGLRNLQPLQWAQGWLPFDRRQFSQEEAVDLITRQRHLNFQPGSQWSYSNSGYILATEMIRRVSGQSPREFMRQRLFQPLGMNATELRDDYRTLVPGQAVGYEKDGERLLNVMPQSVHGPGNLISTPEDMLIWNQALDSGRLGSFVSAELRREARTSDGVASGYARGLTVGSHRGMVEIAHTGGGGGFTAFLARYPEQRLSVAVACNTYLPAPHIGHRIADLYLGGAAQPPGERPRPGGPPGPAGPPAQGVNLPPETVARLAGIFHDGSANARLLNLEAVGGTLREADRPPAEAVSANQFRFPWGDIVFSGPDLIQAKPHMGPEITLRRIDGPRPTQAQLTALTGLYRSEEVQTTYRAALEDGKLVLRVQQGPHFEMKLNAIGPDVFELDGDIFRFVRNERGQVQALLLSGAGLKDLRFDRLPNAG